MQLLIRKSSTKAWQACLLRSVQTCSDYSRASINTSTTLQLIQLILPASTILQNGDMSLVKYSCNRSFACLNPNGRRWGHVMHCLETCCANSPIADNPTASAIRVFLALGSVANLESVQALHRKPGHQMHTQSLLEMHLSCVTYLLMIVHSHG